MNKYKVYKHTNKANGKVYIGLTCNLATKRWCNGNGYKHSTHFYNAIKNSGWDGFEHEIIASGLTKEEACKMEKELISKHKSTQREHGYNSTYGGECNVPTEETKIKMRNNHSNFKGEKNPNWGKSPSEETRIKLSLANKGKLPSELARERAIKYNTGRKDSYETKLKKREARLGEKNPNWNKKHSAETRKKISENIPDFSGANNPRARSVKCNTGEVFKTCKEASQWCFLINGLSHISGCCRGKRNHAGKHPETGERLKWEYC